MTDPSVTETVIEQGKALVRAIEAIGTIEPSGWFERWQARLLQAAYKERLRALVAVLPSWATEEILSASQHIGDDRPAVWFGEN
jgi:hypothetical protein